MTTPDDDLDQELLALLKAPVQHAREIAERIKTAADKYAVAAKRGTLARIASTLSGRAHASAHEPMRDALLELLAAVEEIPEAAALRRELEGVSEPQETPDDTGLVLVKDPPAIVRPFPRVWEASETKGLLVVAGVPADSMRIEWLRHRAARHAWEQLQDGNAAAIHSACQRVKNSNYCGVVLFNATTGAQVIRDVRSACESSRTPLALAQKPGAGTLTHALTTLETALAKAS